MALYYPGEDERASPACAEGMRDSLITEMFVKLRKEDGIPLRKNHCYLEQILSGFPLGKGKKMQVFESIEAFRTARGAFGELGFVPTMGFLHEGHLSLVRQAKSNNEAVAVSIFVNPTQFAPGEDLSTYPRDLERDLTLLCEAGADLVFTPSAETLYPEGFVTRIEVGGVADRLEGAARPGHFSGVATVVTKLLNIVQPRRAYFGQKDAQQCAVIRRLTQDLNSPVEIVIAPTRRESDGLACSSRNVRLTPEDRHKAPALYQALREAGRLFHAGERRRTTLEEAMTRTLRQAGLTRIDYATVVDENTFLHRETVTQTALALVAVHVGPVRLIDNFLLRDFF